MALPLPLKIAFAVATLAAAAVAGFAYLVVTAFPPSDMLLASLTAFLAVCFTFGAVLKLYEWLALGLVKILMWRMRRRYELVKDIAGEEAANTYLERKVAEIHGGAPGQ